MFQLGPASQEAAQIFRLPGGGLHVLGPALAAGLCQRAQRVQPGGVQAGVPDRLVRLFHPGAHLFHLGIIVGVVGVALGVQDVQRCIGAQRRRYVQRVGQQTLAAVGALLHIAVNKILQNVGVQRIALPHKAEPGGAFVPVLPFINGNGVDGGGAQFLQRCLQLLPGAVVAGQGSGAGAFPVSRFDQRQVVAAVGIVAGPGEETGHIVDALPVLPGAAVPQGQIHQHGAAGHIFVRLQERHPPVPHHSLEIAGQFLAAGVVAAGDVLRIVLLQNRLLQPHVHHRGGRGIGCRLDERQFLGGA